MFKQSAALCIASLALGACATAPARGARDVRFGTKQERSGEAVSEVELQEDLQRFTGQFINLVGQAAATSVDTKDIAARDAALRRALVYDSAALDIATGPLPEVNLLDMVVFISLSRSSIDRYWVPKVFGERGAPLSAAFAQSERDVWQIAAKVMTPAQQQQLRDLIAQWLGEHPDQVQVEAVRFTDFSERAGQVESERAKSVSGLFGGVKSVTSAADRALLLADRAMFLAQRIPFLLRAHARIGAQDMLGDALDRVQGMDALVARAPEVEPLVRDLSELAARSQSAAREARRLLEALDPVIAYATQPSAQAGNTTLNHTLDRSNQLVDKTLLLLDRTEKLTAGSREPLRVAAEQADRLVRRWIVYLIVLGAAWSIFFWGGYYLVKRRAASHPQPPLAGGATRAHEPRRGHALRVRRAATAPQSLARRRMRGPGPSPNGSAASKT
jgi:hypothetical protein